MYRVYWIGPGPVIAVLTYQVVPISKMLLKTRFPVYTWSFFLLDLFLTFVQ